MANTLELETLLVRLVGDGSAYQKMLQQAQSSTTQATTVIQNNAKQIEAFQRSVTDFGQAAVAGLASLGVSRYLHEIAEGAMEAEDNLVKLKAAISTQGGNIEGTLATFQNFAAQLSEQTNISKQATLQMLEQATSRGADVEAAQQQVLMATALAKGNETQAKGMQRVAELIQNGHIEHAKRILGLQGVKNATELVEKAQQRMNIGLKAAEDLSKTTRGQLIHLENDLAEVKKQFGALLLEALRPVVGLLRQAVQWFKGLDEQTKQAVLTTAGMVAGIVALIPALKAAGFAISLMFSGSGAMLALLVPLAIATSMWVTSVGGVGEAWEIVKDAVGGWFSTANDYILNLTDGTIGLGGAFAALAVVVMAAVATYYAVSVAVATIIAVYQLLHINQIISFGLWLAWKVVILAAALAMLFFKGVMFLTTAILAGFGIVTLLTSIKALALQVANWLLSLSFVGIAAAVGTALLTLGAFIVALGIMMLVVAPIIAAFFAFGAAVAAVFTALSDMPSIGGLSQIGDMFRGWLGLVGDIVRAVKVDMAFAWRFMKAAAAVVMEELKAMWPPFWQLIKDGFTALWTILASKFISTFGNAMYKIIYVFDEAASKKLIQAVHEAEIAAIEAQDKLSNLTMGDAEETEGLKKRRKEIQGMRNDLEILEALKANSDAEKKKQDEKYKKELDFQIKINDQTKESINLHKVNASLAGSAEAMARISAYHERLNQMRKGEESKKAIADLEAAKDKKGPAQEKFEAAKKKADSGGSLEEFKEAAGKEVEENKIKARMAEIENKQKQVWEKEDKVRKEFEQSRREAVNADELVKKHLKFYGPEVTRPVKDSPGTKDIFNPRLARKDPLTDAKEHYAFLEKLAKDKAQRENEAYKKLEALRQKAGELGNEQRKAQEELDKNKETEEPANNGQPEPANKGQPDGTSNFTERNEKNVNVMTNLLRQIRDVLMGAAKKATVEVKSADL